MVASPSSRMLSKYAEVIVRVGLNLQPGQRLIINNATTRGVGLHAAPLVREVAKVARAAGSPFVDVIWSDPALLRDHLTKATASSAAECAVWHIRALLETINDGGALLTIRSNNPDLLAGIDPEIVGIWQQRHIAEYEAVLSLAMVNKMNWCVAAAAERAWASKVYPQLSATDAEAKLWRTIFKVTRIDQPDPVAAWEKHVQDLTRRAQMLTEREYERLNYRGRGTDLTIGLPEGHRWVAGRERTEAGRDFTANLPTEEVFTLPHRLQTQGAVQATMPLIYSGQRIEGMRLEFDAGRVVQATARKGEATLQKLVSADEGAAYLGEVALVSQRSPIARLKTIFYDTLFDENASCHVAVGSAYRHCLPGTGLASDAEFRERGGNTSMTHVDFMIGSDSLDVDGVRRDGSTEPVMRRGEWAFAT